MPFLTTLVATAAAVTSPAPVIDVPCPFPTGRLPGAVRCSRLTVPQDRAVPGGRALRPLVVRAGTPGTGRPPLALLAGGPGIGGMGQFHELLDSPAGRRLAATRELVVLEPRGTGFTPDRLACEVFTPTLLADRRALRRAVARCASAARRRGIDLRHFGTRDVAEDWRDLRLALGVPAWDVYGVSYGTQVAQVLAQVDPAGARSLVLDSIAPLRRTAAQAEQVLRGRALRRVARDAGGVRRVAARLRALDRRPLAAGDGLELNGGFVAFLVTNTAYLTRAEAPRMPAALRAALRRDPRPLRRLMTRAEAAGSLDRVPAAVRASEAADLQGIATACTDPASARPGRLARDPLVAILDHVVDAYDAACAPLGLPRQDLRPLKAPVPTLGLVGTLDPATPPSLARDVLAGIPGAELLEVRGQAHGVLFHAPVREPLARVLTFLDRR